MAEPPERTGSESSSTGTPSGTLLHKFQVAEEDGTLDETAAANHIVRWIKILQRGPDAFEAAILKERRKIKQEPLVFAIMTGNERIIDVAHGINIITMENEEHDADGLIGFFLGDRIVLTDAGESHYQDPQLWAVHKFSSLATNYKGKTATAQACATQKEAKEDVGLLKKPKKGPNVDIPRLLPIPTEWWDFFVKGKRSPLETYRWILTTTKSWTAEVKKEAAQMARHWGRAACTRANDDDADVSCVSFEAAPVYMDRDSVRWAIYNLASYLPKPKAPPQPTAQMSVTCDDGHSPIIQHALALAHDVIKSNTERNDREKETPKPIPEPLLCRLLGLSGITWEDQHLLTPLWNQLRQQTDKAAKELVLRNFFGSLAKEVPSFKQFRNSTLFDHICSYKFEPGPGYETCHHGISLLAVSMRSVADQDRESQDDAYFAQATNKTPEAVRKYHSKLPPLIPTTVAELLQLLWRTIVLTVGLFTIHCSLAIQLKDLHTALQEREQHILGDPEAAADLIPQLTWAIISGSREFFGIICNRDDVDPPDRGRDTQPPKFAIAQLSIHTAMFRAGYKLNLTNVPDQWIRKTPKTMPKTPKGPGSRIGGHDKRYGDDPFRRNEPEEAEARGNNPNTPKVFTTSEPFRQLKTKFNRLTLSDIVKEAGVRGGPFSLDTAGLPARTCLNWICMGKCTRRPCDNDHPVTVDEAIATTLYAQLEPGIKRMLETGKRPRRERN